MGEVIESDDDRGQPGKVAPRPEQAKERAADQAKKKKELREPPLPPKRPAEFQKKNVREMTGLSSEEREGDADRKSESDIPGINSSEIFNQLTGVARQFGVQIPALESMMMQVPNQLLGQFVGQLPGPLQSLLPPGLIPGIGGTGAISLNGLMQLVGGGALSQVSGQLLRSVGSGLGIANLAGLQSIPITQVLSGVLGGNLSGIVSGQLGNLGSAAISNVLGSLTQTIGTQVTNGIPLNLNQVTDVVGLALRSTGVNIPISSSFLGGINSATAGSIGAIVNTLMGGNLSNLGIPILPSNLSSTNPLILSGLSQFMPPEVAQSILTIEQTRRILPRNLDLVYREAPGRQGGAGGGQSVSGPSGGNQVQQNYESSPQQSGPSNSTPGTGCKGAKQSIVPKLGETRHIPYDVKISESLTLGDVSIHAKFKGHEIPHICPVSGLTAEQIIENLSVVAQTCFEPIKAQFPGVKVNSGFRCQYTSSGNISDHARGMALDLQWEKGPGSAQKRYEIAKWIEANVCFKQILLEGTWIHVSYDKSGAKSGRPTGTQTAGGGLISGIRQGYGRNY